MKKNEEENGEEEYDITFHDVKQVCLESQTTPVCVGL